MVVEFSRDETSGFEASWKSLVVSLPAGDKTCLVRFHSDILPSRQEADLWSS